METIIRIAEVLDVPMNKLFEEKDYSADGEGERLAEGRDTTFTQAFRKALHVIAITDPEGKILEVNESLLEFSGHALDDVLGLQIISANLWQDYHEFKELLQQGFEQAQWGNHFIREIHVFSHNGNEYNLKLIISPVSGGAPESDVDLMIVEAFLNEQD